MLTKYLILVDKKEANCLPFPPFVELGAAVQIVEDGKHTAYASCFEDASEATKEAAMLAVHAFSIAQLCVSHEDFIMSDMRELTKTIVTDLYVVYQMAKALDSFIITNYIEGLFSSVGTWSSKNLGGRYIHDGQEVVFAALL